METKWLLASFLVLIVSCDTTPQNTTVDEEGRFLVRGKPILIYPPTAPTRHQLIVGIGVPIQEIPHSVVFGWVLKAQYYLPTAVGDYEPVNVENWNDSRRAFPDRSRRSVERYEVDNVSVRVEPLEPEPDVLAEDDGYYGDGWLDRLQTLSPKGGPNRQDETRAHDQQEPSPPPATGYDAHNGRWNVYKAIEGLSELYGYGGRACMLRIICEASEAQFTHTGGVFAEMLHIMFSPSTTKETVSDHLDNEYYRAEQLGRDGAPCGKLFRECSTSLLGMFSGVQDLNRATSSFFPL